MFGNQLSLGIVIALRDSFTRPAAQISRGFYSLDDAAYRSARGIRRSLGNIEVGYASVTRTLAAAAAIGATLAMPVKMAAQFARGIKEIGTIADRSTLNVDRLRQQVLSLTDIGQDVSSTTDAAYQAVSAGFTNTADAMLVVAEAAKGGKAALTDTRTDLEALVSVMNAYRMSAKSAAFVSDQLFETITLGRVRMPDLAASIGMIAPVAAGANMPLEQVLGMFSTMTLSGLSASQAAQYSRQIVSSMQKPAAQSKTLARLLHLDWGAAAIDRRHGDVTGMILDAWRRTGSGKDKESFFRLFGGKQSATGLMALLGRDNGALWKQHIAAHSDTMVADPSNPLGPQISKNQRAFQEMMATTAEQGKRLKESFKGLAIEFGSVMEVGVRPFVHGLASIVTGARTLLHDIPGLSKVVYGLGAAFTAALVSFAAMQVWMIRMNPRVRDLMASLSAFSRRIGLVTLNSKTVIPSFMGLVGVIALVGYTLRTLYNEGGAFKQWVDEKVLLVKALAYGLTHMNGLMADIPETMGQALDKAGVFQQYVYWLRILGRIKVFFSGLFQGIQDGFEAQFRFIRQTGREVGNFFDRLGLTKLAHAVRGATSGLHIEESWVGSWLQIGWTVGKIIAGLITLWTVTKTWRGAVLAVQGVLWLATTPVHLLRRGIDGATDGFRAMRTVVRDVISWVSRLARMAAFNLLGATEHGGRVQYIPNRGYSYRGGQYDGHALEAYRLAAPGSLGSWNRMMAWYQGGGMANAMFGARMRAYTLPSRMRTAASNAMFSARMGLYQARTQGLPGLASMMGGGIVGGLTKLKAVGTGAFSALSSGAAAFGRGLLAVGGFFLTNPIGLIILGIVAAVGLLVWKWDAVTKGVKTFLSWIDRLITRIPYVGAAWTHIKGAFASVWQAIKTGFEKYVAPVLDKVKHAFLWVTDLLGLTTNAQQNAITNPFDQLHPQRDARGNWTRDSAEQALGTLGGWLKNNQLSLETGTLDQAHERLYDSVYGYAKRLEKLSGVTNALVDGISDGALARLGQVHAEWSQEARDAAAVRNGTAPDAGTANTTDPGAPEWTPGAMTPLARAIETGARAGTALGIQDSMRRPQWSGDMRLVNGRSPFATDEQRYMARAATAPAAHLTSENYQTEMDELGKRVDRVVDTLREFSAKEVPITLALDGKKVAAGLLGHLRKLMGRDAVAGR